MSHPPPQVGGTIISPAAKLVKPAPMAIVVAKVPAVTKAKAVIDVVDLSDEEDGSRRAAVPVPAPGPRLKGATRGGRGERGRGAGYTL